MHAGFSPYTLPKEVIRCALTLLFWKGKGSDSLRSAYSSLLEGADNLATTQRAPLLVALIFSRRSEFLYEYLYLQVETMVFGPYENSNYSRTHLTLFTVQKSGLCLCVVHISHLLCLALACWGRYF